MHNLSNSKEKFYSEEEYNDNGDLTVPLWFWLLLLFQIKAWWLVALAEMIADQGGEPLAFLYHNTTSWLLGLVQGAPGLIMLFCYPLRGRFPRLAKGSYILLLIGALFGMFINLAYLYLGTRDEAELWTSQLGFDFASVGALILSVRLVDVFAWRER